MTQVRIVDLARRKEIANFKTKSLVDTRIFKSVDKIAARIAEEAAAVLPNKKKWQQTGGQTEEALAYANQISLFSGYHAVSFTKAASLSSSGLFCFAHLQRPYSPLA